MTEPARVIPPETGPGAAAPPAGGPPTGAAAPASLDAAEMRRRLRGRNIAIGVALLVWVVLIYIVAIVKMGGG